MMTDEEARDVADKTFDVWMVEVDRQLEVACGLASDELPDCSYRDWFDDELTATEAVELVLEEVGFDA